MLADIDLIELIEQVLPRDIVKYVIVDYLKMNWNDEIQFQAGHVGPYERYKSNYYRNLNKENPALTYTEANQKINEIYAQLENIDDTDDDLLIRRFSHTLGRLIQARLAEKFVKSDYYNLERLDIYTLIEKEADRPIGDTSHCDYFFFFYIDFNGTRYYSNVNYYHWYIFLPCDTEDEYNKLREPINVHVCSCKNKRVKSLPDTDTIELYTLRL